MADSVRRQTTLNPKLQTSKELKELIDRLSSTSQKKFLLKYDEWLVKWSKFLKEKPYSESVGKWIYTYERVRKAVRSINRYLLYLFTFERNQLIPNTNNSPEGFNAGLKLAIKIHI